MQLDQRECFDVVYHEATKDSHGFLYIDVVPKETWMQFRKGFNDFLVIQGSEIRNVKTNRLKRKQVQNEDKEEGCTSEEEKDPQLPKKKTHLR